MVIDDPAVEAVARTVVGEPDARLLDWSVDTMGGGTTGEVGLTGGLRRITGRLDVSGRPVDWSVVQKQLVRSVVSVGAFRPERDDPRAVDYWRREADVYASGLLEELPEGLVVPRCYRIDEDDGAVALWLEDLPDEGPPRWPLERFSMAARHLGRFAGDHPVEGDRDIAPWMTHGRITEWLGYVADGPEAMRERRRPGFLSRWLDDQTLRRMQRLFDDRDVLLDALAALPSTLCHHDAHRRNLGSRRLGADEQTIALDWQTFGSGHLGEEVGSMVSVSLQYLDWPVDRSLELEQGVLDAYAAGLADAGRSVDGSELRLGFAITASLLMGLGATGAWFAALAHDSDAEERTERIIGQPRGTITREWSRMQAYLMDLGEEALRTLGRLPQPG